MADSRIQKLVKILCVSCLLSSDQIVILCKKKRDIFNDYIEILSHFALLCVVKI